jgi:hypothetical protein
MQSRYDLMNAGVTSDSVDSQNYPDTLSVNFGDFTYANPPYIVVPNSQLQQKPYIFCQAYYGSANNDDIVFNVCNVFHVSLLYEETQIKFPVLSDLNSFIASQGKV